MSRHFFTWINAFDSAVEAILWQNSLKVIHQERDSNMNTFFPPFLLVINITFYTFAFEHCLKNLSLNMFTCVTEMISDHRLLMLCLWLILTLVQSYLM